MTKLHLLLLLLCLPGLTFAAGEDASMVDGGMPTYQEEEQVGTYKKYNSMEELIESDPELVKLRDVCLKKPDADDLGSCIWSELANNKAKQDEEVEAKLKEKWDKEVVRVNGSACLGKCEYGISAVVYPKGEWLLDLRPGDEQKVLAVIEKEFPVK